MGIQLWVSGGTGFPPDFAKGRPRIMAALAAPTFWLAVFLIGTGAGFFAMASLSLFTC
jgi:hypothetical protein